MIRSLARNGQLAPKVRAVPTSAPAPKIPTLPIDMRETRNPGLPLLLKRAHERNERRRNRFAGLRALFSRPSDVMVVSILLAVGLLIFWLTR